MKKIIIAVMMLAVSVPAMAGDFGMAIGALVGAAAGAQVGHGNGKTLATVAGAMIGGKVGSNIEDGGNNSEYVCVNCNNQTAQSHYRSAGEEAAAHRGAADRQAMEQAAAERNAYCSQNPYGCHSGVGYRGNNYAGSYYNRNSNIQWR